jgi:CheY-like chemotaxis protein
VPLRILFADDSMTAQNMGKKILAEAGYDVVAVSNGAAAVKKIAEQKPDIIILDVYMPGYSGLEVCEKVRASLDTAKTPVLLTVGKMEPYKPEDANRVKADGVIIKPFEASDLLAIVKKFEERIALMPPPPPIAVQPVRVERKYEEEQPEPIEHRSSSSKASMQPMVEVPDHMAGSSAFSDLLGPDAPNTTQHFAVNTPAAAFETSVIVPAPPMPAADDEPPVSWKEEAQEEPISAKAVEPEQEIIATPVVSAPEPAEEAPIEATVAESDTQAIQVEASEPEPPHPQFIPIFKEPEFKEPEPEPAAYEMVPTAAPSTGEIEIPREPELQETAEETTRNTVADKVEPGLLSPIEQQMETHALAQPEPEPSVVEMPSADASPAEAAPMEVAPAVMEVTPAESYSAPQPTIEPELKPEPPAVESLPIEQPLTEIQPETPPVEANAIGDSDFEARVAAAMAAYNHAEAVPAPAAAIASPTTESPVAVAVETAPASNIHTPEAFEVAHATAEPAPSFEYHPSAQTFAPVPAAHTAPAPAEFVAEQTPAPQVSAPPAFVPSKLEPAEPEIVHNALTNGMEAAAVAAVAETGADHHNIAQAIHRVMERLKPELVDEIMRELNSKK